MTTETCRKCGRPFGASRAATTVNCPSCRADAKARKAEREHAAMLARMARRDEARA